MIRKLSEWQEVEEHFERAVGHVKIARQLWEMRQSGKEVQKFLDRAIGELDAVRETLVD